MGLLDFLNSDDPAIQQGILQMGLSMLGSKGNGWRAVGNAGMQGLEGAQQYRNMDIARKLRQTEMTGMQDVQRMRREEEARRKALEDLPGKFMVPPSQPGVDATGGMDTALENPNNAASPTGRNDLRGLSQEFIRTPGGLQTGLALQQALQKQGPTYHTVADGGMLIATDPASGREISRIENTKNDPSKQSPISQLLADRAKFPPGSAEYQIIDAAIQKATTHPPGTNVRIDNKLGEGLAKEVGPMISASADRAQGAKQQISNAETIIRAVDTNKLYAGPGAEIRLKGAQIGQLLGVSGRDTNEVILNTRAVVQGLARATVAARSALKGQGQVSDFEGKLLAKAESGNIDDMTASEIKYIAQKNKEYGTKLIEQHNQLLGKARANPTTSGIADFFDVAPAGQVVDWNSLGR